MNAAKGGHGPRNSTPDQAELFTRVADCPATREAVAALPTRVCPLCARGTDRHDPENAAVIRDDRGDLAAWMLSLPRQP